MKAKSGFTLVEILIVVVILGILAAIVIPQFTSASTEAKESALVSDLQSIRSQIELYKIHHNDEIPGTQGETFVVAMTSLTNQDGVVDTSGGTDPAFRYGPYMREIPINPFSTAAAGLNSVSEGATALSGQGDNSTAWHIVTSGVDAGLFQANDDKANPMDPADWHTGY
ncbi:MAG: type II secretion system protein [Planctomycetota bacterium]